MSEFEELVLKMREAQRSWFRWHDRNDLLHSKEYEKRVDMWLERKRREGIKNTTPDMF